MDVFAEPVTIINIHTWLYGENLYHTYSIDVLGAHFICRSITEQSKSY